MKIRITLTYRKLTNERLDVALLSKDMDDTPEFAPRIMTDEVMDELREQIQRVLRDKSVEDGPLTITIEAGK